VKAASHPRPSPAHGAAALATVLLGGCVLVAAACSGREASEVPARSAAPSSSSRFFAHRGLNAFAPENTKLAIQLALERGFENVEIDVRTTRDDAIVVFHDEGLRRWTGDARTVCDVSRAELQAVDPAPFYLREILRVPADVVWQVQDAGDPWVVRLSAAHIATLEEVFATFGNRLTYHLDVKRLGCATPRPVMLRRLVALIERFGLEDHVYVESTDLTVLAMVRAMNPRVRGLYWRDDVFEASDQDLDLIRALGIGAVDLDAGRIVPAKRSRLAGLEVFTFTVNSVRQIEELTGVADYILTDLDVASGELLSPSAFFNQRATSVRVYPQPAAVPPNAAAQGFVPLTQQPVVVLRKGS
jgi:glycerophosphoryl diester phosphodiesterase